MSEVRLPDLSEIYGPDFPSTEQRLQGAYIDPVVQVRFLQIKDAPIEERPTLKAQLNTYLAAAHMLFPEESQIIHTSLDAGSADAG